MSGPDLPLILLRDADVFAPEHLGRRQLLLGAGRVLWMGAAEDEAPRGLPMEVVDLEGRRLLPGLIDGHVHVTGGGGEGGFATRVPPLPLSRYTAGGIAYGYCGGYHLPPATITGSVRGDIVFVEPLIGVGELAISDHRSSQPTFDQLLRVASEAHVAGLMTSKAGIVHLHLGDGARGLELVRRALSESELPARVFNPTHVNRRKALFEEAVELARRGCSIDLTAFPVEEGEDAWSAADALQRYLESGAPPERITVSSDAGGCLPCFDGDGRMTHMDVGAPGAMLTTLRELTARGLPLERALPAFTANVARLLRLPGKGVIAVGADADLLVLDQHGSARDVIAGGRWHRRDGQQCLRGTFEK
jgi:beta-aspartyl-dipeptidase (metallo-type)